MSALVELLEQRYKEQFFKNFVAFGANREIDELPFKVQCGRCMLRINTKCKECLGTYLTPIPLSELYDS